MYEKIEELMKPGKLSMGGFLGEGEKLEEVLQEDDKTVRRLGVTHEQIASRIEYFIRKMGYPKKEGIVIDGKYLVGGIAWRGGQECPWGDSLIMPYSNMDLFIENLDLGERLYFPGGIVHLIREHHFYEGKKSPYRVDPEKAVRILNIK